MSGKKMAVFIVVSNLLLLAGPTYSPVRAQVVTGSIVGTIKDTSGAVIPGASVVATSVATGLQREAVTDDEGQYTIPNVPAGDYRIKASHTGFQSSVIERMELRVLQTASIDLTLQAGSVTEELTVTGNTSPILDTETSDLGRVVTEEEIKNLPLNGRDYLQLATLTPGVNTFYSNQTAPVRGSAFFQGSGFLAGTQSVGTSISVGVNRESATDYRIDGISITNPFVGQSALLPSIDALREFRVVTFLPPATLSAPASVNAATRSGSNEFHGSLYEYFRNDALDARSFFDVSKPALRMNQFGGSLGGPIVGDKTFFFVNYEGFRGRTPRTVFAIVPTEAQRSGDFSAPGTLPIMDPQTGSPFPGNVIPADRISQFARVFDEFLPAPNFTGSGSLAPFNYTAHVSPTFENDQVNVRFDHTFSEDDSLYGRYSYFDTFNSSPGIHPLYGVTYPYDAQNVVISENHAFGPSLFNQFVLGYTRSELFVTQEGADERNVVAELGLRNIAGGEDAAQFGLPTLSITGLGVFGPGITFTPRGGTLNLYEVQDNVNYVRGAHNLQFGVDVIHRRYDTINPTAPRGYFVYLPFHTGNALADYLLGFPTFAIGDAGNSLQALRWTTFDLYVQDNWRVNQRLTLNLGLRYQYFTPPEDEYNNQSYFDFDCPCIVTAASGEIDNGIFDPPKRNFAPRLGLAWTPFDDKTVVRAGYAMAYFPIIMAENLFLRNNPPLYTLHFIFNSPPQPITSFFPPPLPGPAPNTTIFTVDPNAETPYYQQWSLNVERQLFADARVTVGYVGSRGIHLQRRINMNQAAPGLEPLQARRPYPQFGDILLSSNDGISNYHALQVTFLKQFSRGFSFWASYEHANGFDDATNEGEAPADRRNLALEYGRSLHLVRDRLRLTGIFELPFGRGKALLGDATGVVDKLVGGWQVNAIGTFQSGTPLTVTAPPNNTGGFIAFRADRLCEGNLSGSERTLERWFDTSCFAVPAPGTIGASPRGAIIGPGLNNWDIAVVKDTAIGEQKDVRFQAQFFNAFNHAQFNAPVTDASSPAFGRITSALQGRSVQLSLEFRF
jgi:hypothetical protein